MNDLFIMHFMMTSLASSIILLLILMVKKGLKKHISIRWQYNMVFLFFILLVLPFIPIGIMDFINIGNRVFNGLRLGQSATTDMNAVGEGGMQTVNGMSWLQDFTTSVDRTAPGYIAPLFMLIWLIGIVALILFTFICNRNLRLIKESMKPIPNEEMVALFTRCKAELGIKRNILLGSSILVKSPMAIGFLRMRIILPADIWKTSSIEDIRYILLHELTHCKNKDVLVNHAMCLFQILYWFNPLVYFAFKEMRLDREIACDLSVLKRLPEEHHIEYGKTLLTFIHKLSYPATLFLANEMRGSKRQIKKRVESIASFQTESRWLKVKSICVFTCLGFLILKQIPTITALASYEEGKYHFQTNDVVYEDLSPYFNDYDGSFVLYDLNTHRYTIHNRDKSVTRVSPDSTYKIFSALIALETGVIDTNHSIREWDGATHPIEAWNQDQNLKTAMHHSVNWYFQDLDARVGIKELESYFKRLSYGNHNLSGGIIDYWMESSLRISPVEQVELLKSLYQNDTLFKTEHVNTMKDILRLTEKDGAILSGKTGTGSVNGKVINGWFIGYVENNGHTVIFATNIQGKDDAGGSAAVKITLSILEDKGFY